MGRAREMLPANLSIGSEMDGALKDTSNSSVGWHKTDKRKLPLSACFSPLYREIGRLQRASNAWGYLQTVPELSEPADD